MSIQATSVVIGGTSSDFRVQSDKPSFTLPTGTQVSIVVTTGANGRISHRVDSAYSPAEVVGEWVTVFAKNSAISNSGGVSGKIINTGHNGSVTISGDDGILHTFREYTAIRYMNPHLSASVSVNVPAFGLFFTNNQLAWTPCYHVHTANSAVVNIELFALVRNNTGGVVNAEKMSFSTGDSDSGQHPGYWRSLLAHRAERCARHPRC